MGGPCGLAGCKRLARTFVNVNLRSEKAARHSCARPLTKHVHCDSELRTFRISINAFVGVLTCTNAASPGLARDLSEAPCICGSMDSGHALHPAACSLPSMPSDESDELGEENRRQSLRGPSCPLPRRRPNRAP